MEEQLNELKEACNETLTKYRDEDSDNETSKIACENACKLAKTAAEIDNMREQQKLEKKKFWLSIAKMVGEIGILGLGGFIFQEISDRKERDFRCQMSRESWIEAKDGIITSPTGKYWDQEAIKKGKR